MNVGSTLILIGVIMFAFGLLLDPDNAPPPEPECVCECVVAEQSTETPENQQ